MQAGKRVSKTQISIVFFGVLLLVSSGCSAYRRIDSLSPTFLEDVDTSKKLENLPFMHSWIWNEVDSEAESTNKYKALYIKPIRTDLLPEGSWRSSASAAIVSKEGFMEKADEIAVYFHEQLLSDMRKYKDFKYQIADQPGPGVAVVEIVLTELELSHPVTKAATYASPIPGTGAALGMVTTPHVAFAMRITDGETNQLLVTIADRKFPPTRIVDFNSLTISSSAREICQSWAAMITETFQVGRFAKVSSKGVFRLKPW